MRTIYVSALAFIVLSVGLYFAFHDLLFPIPGTPVEEIAERVSGSGFEDLAALLRPTDAIEALDDVSFILAPDEPFEPAEPRVGEVRLPDQVLAAIQAGDRRAYPVEIASLAVATLRSRRQGSRAAQVMEVTALEGVPSPDPSGRYGYYVVEVDGEILDLFGARKEPKVETGRLLEDVEVVAAAGALSALVEVTRGVGVTGALRKTRRAHEIDPKSPSIRSLEGTVLMVAGQFEEAAGEFEAALSLSPDPARKNVVAGLKLASGDTAAARKLVEESIEEDPQLAPAYVTRAGIELARGDFRGARASLSKAESIDPNLRLLSILYAQIDLAEGDPASASRRISADLKQHPEDAETHMAAVQIFHAAQNYDAMRRSVQAVLRLSPPEQRGMLEEQIRMLFGPSALMPPLDLDDDDYEEEVEESPKLELRLDPSVSPFGDEFKLREPGVSRGSKLSFDLDD
jgi:tetratricopeptide (TPR) repeat protein